jgi:exosome complex RNA-binding protein Rrp42 (RNase PH superfamily)
VVDLTAEEEPCASAVLHVSVDARGRVSGTSKAGPGGIQQPVLLEMLEVAAATGQRLVQELDGFLGAAAAAASAGLK